MLNTVGVRCRDDVRPRSSMASIGRIRVARRCRQVASFYSTRAGNGHASSRALRPGCSSLGNDDNVKGPDGDATARAWVGTRPQEDDALVSLIGGWEPRSAGKPRRTAAVWRQRMQTLEGQGGSIRPGPPGDCKPGLFDFAGDVLPRDPRCKSGVTFTDAFMHKASHMHMIKKTRDSEPCDRRSSGPRRLPRRLVPWHTRDLPWPRSAHSPEHANSLSSPAGGRRVRFP